jgi:nucleoid-associated protein YgaU
MRYAWLTLVIVFLSGCLARTYVTQKPRVDTEIKGNQGYLFGEPTQAEKEHQVKEKRTISVLEIELGSHQPREIKPKAQIPVVTNIEPQEPQASISEEEESLPASEEKKYTSYTIQNGDTLQKISMKFYGTTRKWKMLYNENKDVLKSPDKIRPGKTIKIPQLEK